MNGLVQGKGLDSVEHIIEVDSIHLKSSSERLSGRG